MPTDYAPDAWRPLVEGNGCAAETPLTRKDGTSGGTITCEVQADVRHLKFPPGMFDIDVQVPVPEKTTIEGSANPNDATDKTLKPDPSTQTFFIATSGISDENADYCGTNGTSMQQGDAQKLRIGFLLHSHTTVRNINFQGKDTTRPLDNGNLCGGGAFETPGCVSPGFGDGTGVAWLDDGGSRTGCVDHTGVANELLIGDGKGVENVVIENVRLNDLLLADDATTPMLVQAQGSQVAVWVAQTQDGSYTRNVRVTNLVSMLTRGDGINFHGYVQDSIAEGCHIENTGDDVYAAWGGYATVFSNITFRDNVAKNAGVTRNYGYGVCVAVYGGLGVEVTGTSCHDIRDWNPSQPDDACLNGMYCNSCLAYVHDGWFGAIYPDNNTINIHDNTYVYMDDGSAIPVSEERPLIRHDSNSSANVVSGTANSDVSSEHFVYFA